MSFRRRIYPEVIENMLTFITGGVDAEGHPFPQTGAVAPDYFHALEKPPVKNIVSVYGTRNGKPHTFKKDADFKLDADQQTLKWEGSAELPDLGTVFYVNYMTQQSSAEMNDISVGSVLRTLTESVGLEISRLYASLEGVYKAGFIDTATKKSLDNVVALLGIKRVAAGRNTCEIELTRVSGTRGSIYVPSGTRIMTEDGKVEYETTTPVTLLDRQDRIKVSARDIEENHEELPADSLTVLAKPIAGIEKVRNPSPSKMAAKAESDEQLRIRAKSFLHGSERATLGALKEAVARQGVLADIVEKEPGKVEVIPHVEQMSPEMYQQIETAIEDVRPVGVCVELKIDEMTSPQRVNIAIHISTKDGLLETDMRAAQESVKEKISHYFSQLPIREAGSINKIVGMVLEIPEIEDVQIVSASLSDALSNTVSVLDFPTGKLLIEGVPTVLGDLQIADPNLPSRLAVTIRFPNTETPPDESEIHHSLNTMVTYINDQNQKRSEALSGMGTGSTDEISLSFGTLLYILPLAVTDKPFGSLQAYDEAVEGGAAPAFPDETSIAPYVVQFVFTMETGLSQICERISDSDYVLTPYERITLADVQIHMENGS